MSNPAPYSDEDVAALYNQLNPWGASDDFYFPLVMAAESVLDVGCGTGMMLHTARDQGQIGRLVGIDPDVHALAIARKRTDIEWIDGKADELAFDAEFDLAIMISHAFQFIVEDEEIDASLLAIFRALKPGGLFAFETRNPGKRAWEQWDTAEPETIVDPTGRRIVSRYEAKVDGECVVDLAEFISNPDGTVLRTDRARMRFLSQKALNRRVSEAGFEIEEQYGDWDRSPVEISSPEIITIARKPSG